MSQRSQSITVEQLIALNDEIRALARAGIPLEQGLRAVGGDLPGRLGKLARSLALRLERGEGLVQAVEASSEAFPPAYCAVIAAGIRSGCLSAALESISRSVRQAAELRRTLMVALAYPFLLAAIATAVFLFSVWNTIPVVRDVFVLLDVSRPAWYEWSTAVADQIARQMPWIWVAILSVASLWWIRSRRAARFGASSLRWLPTVGAVRNAGRMATFAELLAMLVEQQIPLDEALTLAAKAGGGEPLQQASAAIVQALRRGERSIPSPRGIPPLLAWLLLTSDNQNDLARALRHSAASYRRRAVRMSLVLGTYLPIFLSAFAGGLVALYYVVLTMAPFYYLLRELGRT